MAHFDEAIVKTRARKGGATFTDVAGDSGGATKYGISQKAYPTLDIRNLTEQQARYLQRRLLGSFLRRCHHIPNPG